MLTSEVLKTQTVALTEFAQKKRNNIQSNTFSKACYIMIVINGENFQN